MTVASRLPRSPPRLSEPIPLGLPVWLLLHPNRVSIGIAPETWHLLEPGDVTYPTDPTNLLSCPLPNPKALSSYAKASLRSGVYKQATPAHLRKREGIRRTKASLGTIDGAKDYVSLQQPREPIRVNRITLARDPRRLPFATRQLVMQDESDRESGVPPGSTPHRTPKAIDFVKLGLPPPMHTPTIPWLTSVIPLSPGDWIVNHGPPATPIIRTTPPIQPHDFPWLVRTPIS